MSSELKGPAINNDDKVKENGSNLKRKEVKRGT